MSLKRLWMDTVPNGTMVEVNGLNGKSGGIVTSYDESTGVYHVDVAGITAILARDELQVVDAEVAAAKRPRQDIAPFGTLVGVDEQSGRIGHYDATSGLYTIDVEGETMQRPPSQLVFEPESDETRRRAALIKGVYDQANGEAVSLTVAKIWAVMLADQVGPGPELDTRMGELCARYGTTRDVLDAAVAAHGTGADPWTDRIGARVGIHGYQKSQAWLNGKHGKVLSYRSTKKKIRILCDDGEKRVVPITHAELAPGAPVDAPEVLPPSEGREHWKGKRVVLGGYTNSSVALNGQVATVKKYRNKTATLVLTMADGTTKNVAAKHAQLVPVEGAVETPASSPPRPWMEELCVEMPDHCKTIRRIAARHEHDDELLEALDREFTQLEEAADPVTAPAMRRALLGGEGAILRIAMRRGLAPHVLLKQLVKRRVVMGV